MRKSSTFPNQTKATTSRVIEKDNLAEMRNSESRMNNSQLDSNEKNRDGSSS